MKENKLTKTWVVCILATLCCVLWGSAFPCIKIGYKLFNIAQDSTSSQILFAGIRFILAGIIAIIICSFTSKKVLFPTSSSITKIIKLSMFQTILQYTLFYIGLANTTGVKASIVEASNVFIAILVSAIIFKFEKVTAKKLIGCAVGFIGVIIINIGGLSQGISMNFMGDGLVFMSTFMYAFSSVLMKKYSKTENPVMMSGYQFLFGGIIMLIVGLLMGGKVTITGINAIIMLIYLALISAVSYSIWSMLLKYNPVSKVTIFGFMNPVTGVILSAILLNEGQTFGIESIGALIFVCLGIYIVNKE